MDCYEVSTEYLIVIRHDECWVILCCTTGTARKIWKSTNVKLFFFQIGANSGWVISHRGERVQVCEVEAVVQMVTNGAVQRIKTRPTCIHISWTALSWALKLSGSSWQTSTGKVFQRQIAVGKKVWLYVFVLHWIWLCLVLDPLVWAVAGWR